MGLGLGSSAHGAPAVTVLEAKAAALNAIPLVDRARARQDTEKVHELRLLIRRYLALIDSGIAAESDHTVARLRKALADS